MPKWITVIVTEVHNDYKPFKQKKSNLNHRISEVEETLEMHYWVKALSF